MAILNITSITLIAALFLTLELNVHIVHLVLNIKLNTEHITELKITACHLSFSGPKATMTDQIKSGLT